MIAAIFFTATASAHSRKSAFPRITPAAPFGVTQPSQVQPDAKLKSNQTLGFGADRVLNFTYQQQSDCLVQPNDDRNYTGVVAALSPAQFNFPQCQVGAPSSIDPTGGPISKTDKIWVLVPFFETDPKQPAFFRRALGKQRSRNSSVWCLDVTIQDSSRRVRAVSSDPGLPPGTCTMHPVQTDLGPVLASLNSVPPKTVVNVPLVNHSHFVANNAIVTQPEWWQVVVIALVTDPKGVAE